MIPSGTCSSPWKVVFVFCFVLSAACAVEEIWVQETLRTATTFDRTTFVWTDPDTRRGHLPDENWSRSQLDSLLHPGGFEIRMARFTTETAAKDVVKALQMMVSTSGEIKGANRIGDETILFGGYRILIRHRDVVFEIFAKKTLARPEALLIAAQTILDKVRAIRDNMHREKATFPTYTANATESTDTANPPSILDPNRLKKIPTHEPKPLSEKSQARLEAVRDSGGTIERILSSPGDKGTPIDPLSININIRHYSLEWIRRVVRPEFLPGGFETKIQAAKGVKFVDRKPNPDGTTTIGFALDIFYVDIPLPEETVHIQETGHGVAIRINFSKEEAIDKDPELKLHGWLLKYFNIPHDAFLARDIKIDRKAEVVHAHYKNAASKQPENDGDTDTRQWWHRIDIWSDGSFVYASFAENMPGIFHPVAKFGPPARF